MGSVLQDFIIPRFISTTSSKEDISSPIAAQILDFCDDGSGGDLFPDTTASGPPLRSCEDVSSSPAAAAAFSPFPSLDSTALSALLDQQQPPDGEPELIPPMQFPYAAPQAYVAASDDRHQPVQFNQITLSDALAASSSYSTDQVLPIQMGGPAVMPPSTTRYDEDCFAAAMAGGYAGLEAALYPGNMVAGEAQGYYTNGSSCNGMVMVGTEEVGEYQSMMENGGMIGTYSIQDTIPRTYSSGDMQVVGGSSQHMIGACSGSSMPLSSSEISSLDDSTFKVGRLSVEERKEKIHRYMKKRNERNFSKKIKYACRKTLADSRPRVRGRFAKNDEFGEATRPSSHNHEFDDEEEVVVKEEEDVLDSSDILAHISGVNSFKYNYTLESWI
ncbi:uncharacterized protein [Typha latifolia]|uniref:uncharacterized protein isoform X1 n=1 Tax=Typha latifolia TaxID=4733 RepID=UPI003C2D4AE9